MYFIKILAAASCWQNEKTLVAAGDGNGWMIRNFTLNEWIPHSPAARPIGGTCLIINRHKNSLSGRETLDFSVRLEKRLFPMSPKRLNENWTVSHFGPPTDKVPTGWSASSLSSPPCSERSHSGRRRRIKRGDWRPRQRVKHWKAPRLQSSVPPPFISGSRSRPR